MTDLKMGDPFANDNMSFVGPAANNVNQKVLRQMPPSPTMNVRFSNLSSGEESDDNQAKLSDSNPKEVSADPVKSTDLSVHQQNVGGKTPRGDSKLMSRKTNSAALKVTDVSSCSQVLDSTDMSVTQQKNLDQIATADSKLKRMSHYSNPVTSASKHKDDNQQSENVNEIGICAKETSFAAADSDIALRHLDTNHFTAVTICYQQVV